MLTLSRKALYFLIFLTWSIMSLTTLLMGTIQLSQRQQNISSRAEGQSIGDVEDSSSPLSSSEVEDWDSTTLFDTEGVETEMKGTILENTQSTDNMEDVRFKITTISAKSITENEMGSKLEEGVTPLYSSEQSNLDMNPQKPVKCQPSLTFVMETFPWQIFSEALVSKDPSAIKPTATKLLLELIPFLTLPPLVPVNTSCYPPPLRIPSHHRCKVLEKPRKVGVLFQFAFEVDTLEIHLNELNDLVDKFFLIESIAPHSPYVTHKPLLWSSLKEDIRFSKFTEKIVHFIVDDADLIKVSESDGLFGRENLQEKLRWEKFLEWNRITQFFSNDDILGFGDVDEIPNRDNIYYLKNCELNSDPIDIGIWFPFESVEKILETDHPVKNHSFTLGDPTYWTLGQAINISQTEDKYPSRNRGRSSSYLLGGMHTSSYAYPPLRFIKLLTPSEYTLEYLELVRDAGFYYSQGEVDLAEETIRDKIRGKMTNRLLSVEDYRRVGDDADDIIKAPWFYNCNIRRYPGFKLEHDTRLD